MRQLQLPCEATTGALRGKRLFDAVGWATHGGRYASAASATSAASAADFHATDNISWAATRRTAETVTEAATLLGDQARHRTALLDDE